MARASPRQVWVVGLTGGLAGGAFLAAAQAFATALAREPPPQMFRAWGSLLLGRRILEGLPNDLEVPLGLAVHLVVAGALGVAYGLLVSRLGTRRRDSFASQFLYGALFGAAVWVVNYQLLSRVLFPAMRAADPVRPALQLVLHVIAFGVPLGWWVAMKLRDFEVEGVHVRRHLKQTPSGPEEREVAERWMDRHHPRDEGPRPPGP